MSRNRRWILGFWPSTENIRQRRGLNIAVIGHRSAIEDLNHLPVCPLSQKRDLMASRYLEVSLESLQVVSSAANLLAAAVSCFDWRMSRTSVNAAIAKSIMTCWGWGEAVAGQTQ